MKPYRVKYKIRDIWTYWKLFSQPEADTSYKVYKLNSEHTDDLMAAKKLHAEVYLSKGFIDRKDIRDEMIHDMSDPHQHHAEYFVVKKGGEIVGLARQIAYKGGGLHHESFPVLKKGLLYETQRNAILALHPSEIVEVSALVKKTGESSVVPLILYRALWRHSIEQGHQLWIMACDPRLYDRLSILFGPALHRIGDLSPYPGAPTIPVAVSIEESLKYTKEAKRHQYWQALDIRKQAAKFVTKGRPS